MPSNMSVRRTFKRLLGSLTSYLIRVMRGGGPNMSLLTDLARQLAKYDESWCPHLAHLPCKNGNDRYETDSDLACLFYVQERIKRGPSWRNSIADLFYGWGKIKGHHFRRMFYGGIIIIMHSQKYIQTKRRKEWDRVLGIFSYTWSSKLF